MKKAIYTPPIMEELKVDDMQLLAGSENTGTASDFGPGGGQPDPERRGARETQFDEFE